MSKRGLSQSGISVYRYCPYAYKLHYIDLKQPIHFNPAVMDVGKYVHDVIDRYYQNYYLSEGTANDVLIKTYDILKNIWDITLPPEQFKKAYDCLINHSQWEEKNINGSIGTKPLTEVKIDSGDYFGLIDYVDLNNLKLIDYKTSTHPVLSYEYRMQAHIYRELFESKFNKTISHFYFFFLYPNEWRTVKYDSDKQRKVGKDVENFKELILNCEFPKEPRTKSSCNNCEYKLYCKVIK